MPDPTKIHEGPPCARCGNTTRWNCNNGCVECEKARCRRDYQADPERKREQMTAYHQRMYHGTGTKSFLYRAGRALQGRRHAALKRQQRRKEQAVG